MPPTGADGRAVSKDVKMVGQILYHVQQFWVHLVEGDRQVRTTVGTQGAEKSLTSRMTPILGRSWGVGLRGQGQGRGPLGVSGVASVKSRNFGVRSDFKTS